MSYLKLGLILLLSAGCMGCAATRTSMDTSDSLDTVNQRLAERSSTIYFEDNLYAQAYDAQVDADSVVWHTHPGGVRKAVETTEVVAITIRRNRLPVYAVGLIAGAAIGLGLQEAGVDGAFLSTTMFGPLFSDIFMGRRHIVYSAPNE